MTDNGGANTQQIHLFWLFCFCCWPFSSSFCFIFSYFVLETNVCTSLKVWQKHGVLVSSGKMMIQNLHLSIRWIFHLSTSLLWVCTVRTFWCMRWNVSNFVLFWCWIPSTSLRSFPKTNVLWLQYLVDILLSKKSYVSLFHNPCIGHMLQQFFFLISLLFHVWSVPACLPACLLHCETVSGINSSNIMVSLVGNWLVLLFCMHPKCISYVDKTWSLSNPQVIMHLHIWGNLS